MPPLRILISGASIAGPTTAYWLRKIGATITVLERAPGFRTAGQNIDIRSTGVTIMRRTPGLETSIRSKLVPMEGMAFVREDGSELGRMGATGDVERQSIVSEFEVLRGDLARVLVEKSREGGGGGVKYVYGEQIASLSYPYQQAEGGNCGPVRVEFANGRPTEDFDLVIACDGANSRTRALAFDVGVREHMHPVKAWAAYFSVPKDLLDGSKVAKARSFPGGRVMAIGPKRGAGCQVTVMKWYPSSAAETDLEPFRHAQKDSTGALKEIVAAQIQGEGWVSDDAVDGLMATDEFYASELAQVKVPTLFRKRCVLVGDAGYAAGPTGTGTSMAMTGAYILAGEIGAHPGDLEAGLRAYEERMRPIVEEMQIIPPGVGSVIAPQTETGIWLRNSIFQIVCAIQPWVGWLPWLGSLWTASFGSSERFRIPEYEFRDFKV